MAGRAVVVAATVLAVSATPTRGQEGVAMFRGGPTHPGEAETGGVEELGRIRWEVATEGPVRSSPTLYRGTVYVGSDGGGVYAIDLETGAVDWRFDTGRPVPSAPAVDAERVYVTDVDGRIFAVGRRDGALRWEVPVGPTIPFPWGLEGWDYLGSSPVLAGGRLVAGAADGTVRAVDARTGELLWSHRTGGRVRASPAVADGTVYVGSADGVFYALNLEDGTVQWRFETAGAALDPADFGFDRTTIQGGATVVGDTVFFGSRDARSYALDRRTGDEIWSVQDGTAWVIATPAVVDGTVYEARSSSARVRALDVAGGDVLWSVQLGGAVFASPVVVDRTLYVTSGGRGELVALDTSSGEPRWRMRLGAASWSSPAAGDGVLVVGADDGVVRAVEATSGPSPRRAVFWDEGLRDRAVRGRQEAHRDVVDYFEAWGYEVLDASALATFLRERIADGVPSVVVMAMDALPGAVAPSPEPRGPLHDYLRAGGKVVWTGFPPMFFVQDEEGGGLRTDRSRPTRFTGVDHAVFNADAHTHRATPAGERWGLDGWWMGPGGVEPADVTEVLATDDPERAAAWVRSYGGPEGTGWVSLVVGQSEAMLERLRVVAERGVFRRP